MTQETTPQDAEVPGGMDEASAADAILQKMGIDESQPAEGEPEEEPEQPVDTYDDEEEAISLLMAYL